MNKEEFKDDFIPASNWMKFEKVGDYVKGTFVSRDQKPAQGKFPEQTVYELVNVEAITNGEKLELEKDDSVYVGVSKDFVNSKLKKVEPGRRMGLVFKEGIPSKTKGYADAKSYLPYVWEMDQSYVIGGEEMVDDNEIKVDEIPFK